MLKSSSGPIDVQDFQFKLHCKLKIFENTAIEPFSKPCNLVATASLYGLLFVGTKNSFQVVRCADLDQISVKDGEKSDFLKRNIVLDSCIRHLSVNCDSSLLAVVSELEGCPFVQFYEVKSFFSENVNIVNRLQLSSKPGTNVLEVSWNPSIPDVFTACKDDGSLGVYEIKKNVSINELPSEASATCCCWSPKGKQLAVGSRDGKITQYKPDLKAVRVINAPPLQEPHSLLSLQWISNYQFIGIYVSVNSDPSANLIVIDAPKTGEVSYTTFDDICYSSSPVRPVQFYMIHEPQWNILMVASSNSMEVGVMYNVGDTWTQLTLIDSARAELPLSSEHCDTLPIGFGFHTGSTEPLPWGEGTIPPAPKLFLMSHYGILCCFNTVNLKQNIPLICSPPMKVETTSPLLFTRNVPEITSSSTSGAPAISIVPVTLSINKQQNVSLKEDSHVSETSSSVLNSNKSATFPMTMPQQLIKPQQNANPLQPSQNLFQPSSGLFQKNQNLLQQNNSLFQQNQKPPQQNISFVQQTINPAQSNLNFMQQSASTVKSQSPKLTASAGPLKVASDSATIVPVPKPQIVVPQKSDPVNYSETQANASETTDLNDNELNYLLSKLIREECIALETELRVLLHQANLLKIDIGTEEEKNIITDLTTKLDGFLIEVVNNYTVQKSDVHVLKQNLLQTWAWLEEARSRHNASNDGTITALLRAMPLDSAAEKQLLHIRHLMYYLDSQLKQAHDSLDDQWESFQDYCKKTYKMQLPTIEVIFQTMVRHKIILNKLSYSLKDISTRVKFRNQGKSAATPLVAMNTLQKIQESMENLSIGHQHDVFKIHYDRVLQRNMVLTPSKTSKLRSFLKQNNVKSIQSYKASADQSSNLISKLKNTSISIKPSSASGSGPRSLGSTVGELESGVRKSEIDKSTIKSNFTLGDLQQGPLSKFSSPLAHTQTNTNYTLSAFVPTTNSINLPDSSSGQMSFKGGSSSSSLLGTFEKSTPNKSLSFSVATTTSGTVKPLFSNKIDFAAASIVPSTSHSPSSVQVTGSTPASNLTPQVSYQFLPQTKPLTFSSSSGGDDNPVIVIETNTSNASISQISGLKLPSEITLTKTQTTKPQSNLLTSELQTTKISPATTASQLPNFSGTVGITIGKTFIPSTKPVFENSKLAPDQGTGSTSLVKPTQSSISTTVGSVTTTEVSSVQSFRFNIAGGNTQVTEKSDGSVLFKAAIKPNENLFASVAASTDNQSNALLALGNNNSIFGKVSISPVTSVAASVTSSVSGKSSDLQPITQSISPANSKLLGTGSDAIEKANLSVDSSKSVFSTVPSSTIVTTQSSIFDGTKSIFAPANLSTPTAATTSSQQTTVSSIFGSMLGTKPAETGTPNFSFATTATSQSSIFGSVQPTVSQSSLFGITPKPVSTQNSVIGTSVLSASQGSIFGSPAVTSTVSSTPSKPLVFSAPQTVEGATTSQSSIFSAPQSTSVPPVSQTLLFGTTTSSPVAPTATQQSIFGAPPSTTSQNSVFAGIQTSSFGSTTTTTTTKPSVFGTFSTTSGSIFGNPSSTSSSIFGNTADTSTSFGGNSGKSIFGNVPVSFTSTTTSASPFSMQSSSIFGTPKSTTSSGTSFTSQNTSFGGFGSTPATSGFQSSPFGSVLTSSPASGIGTSSSAFVNLTPSQFGTQSSSQSVFGAPTSSNTFSFSSPSSNTTTFGFGGLNVGSTTTASNNSFGANANPFAKTSVFGTPSTQSSIFGTSSPANQSSNIFGSNPTSSQSSSIFGGGSAATPSTQSSIFGSSSVFGSPAQSSFGAQSTFGSAPVFGQQPTFGQSTFGTSAGPFSGGNSSVSQSGFGAPPAFQKPAGFGSPPTFGSSPGFGTSPSFGGAPTFGSSPTFGSPDKVFGSSTMTASFQASTQENPTFANLANQNTIGFGSLAQQAQNASGSSFSSNSSFSSWR